MVALKYYQKVSLVSASGHAGSTRRNTGPPKWRSHVCRPFPAWSACRLFELLPMMPRFTVEKARQQLSTSFPTANAAVKLLMELGIVMEMTGQQRKRTFGYQSYIAFLARAQ
jgi:hypothetical protein